MFAGQPGVAADTCRAEPRGGGGITALSGTQLLHPKEGDGAVARHPGCFRVQFPATLSISRSLPTLVALPCPCWLEQRWRPCLDPYYHQPGLQ